jgi:hypothetical protein
MNAIAADANVDYARRSCVVGEKQGQRPKMMSLLVALHVVFNETEIQ